MNKTEAKEFILEHSTNYFERDKSGKGFICPICGSGSGTHGTGITENPQSRKHFSCWAGCFNNADIFEIIGKQYNTNDFNEQFKIACEFFRITLDEQPSLIKTSQMLPAQERPQIPKDFINFFKEAAQHINETNYHRGLSDAILKYFQIGYISEWQHPKIPNAPTTPRLIIPNSKMSYLARDTRDNLTKEQKGYSKMRVGTSELFNKSALLQTEKPVFIVEGEFDAMSIYEVGGQAIGLCSIANKKKIIDFVREHLPNVPPLIISLDNDEKGQKATKELTVELDNLNFSSYRVYSLPEGMKDANEFLNLDRESFAEWVKNGADYDFEDMERDERKEFEHEAVSYQLNSFLEEVVRNREGMEISTGFKTLDEMLDGGFYPGLYVPGANSSLGKTTFTLQIGDNMAQAGYGVLIFSLEMGTNELIAKTLSRLSLIKSLEKYGSKDYAKTTRGILKGTYTDKEKTIIFEAIQEYQEWGKNIHITEGIGNVGVEHIKKKIEKYMKFNDEKPPVVIIDYLQVLAPYSEKMTDKQNVDKNILELKRISRDYQIPVIGISSFNRENYSSPVSMSAFKESGAIEYTSDVLIGLQYNGWDYQEEEKSEKDSRRAERLREIKNRMDEAAANLDSQEIQLKILKNRNGRRGSIVLKFSPAFNYFYEVAR